MADTEGRFRAIRLGSTKIPEPITIPMTIAVASRIPRRRGRFCMRFDSDTLLRIPQCYFLWITHWPLMKVGLFEAGLREKQSRGRGSSESRRYDRTCRSGSQMRKIANQR